MSRYFLDIEYDGKTHRDIEGAEFVDTSAAIAEAENGLRELLGEAIRGNRPDPPTRIVVKDAEGHVVRIVASHEVLPSKLRLI